MTEAQSITTRHPASRWYRVRPFRAPLIAAGLALAACAPGDQADQADEAAAGASTAAASSSYSGSLSASGTHWASHPFAVAAPAKLDLTLDWDNAASNLNLFLYDPAGKLVTYDASTTDKPAKISYTATAPGQYSFGISCKSASAKYTVTVAETPLAAGFPAEPAAGSLYWGAASSNGSVVTRFETPSGHPLALHRTYYSWGQRTTSLVSTASDDLAHDRLPWVSVKTPSWAEMGAGEHDAEIDQMLTKLEALAKPVWLTVWHEPEGGGGNPGPDDPSGPTGHKAMNKRVRERMQALGTKNISLSIILMSWTWDSRSGRNPNDWWEPGVYDFLGIDHYAGKDASLVTPVWLDVRQWAASKGVGVAVGEWGTRGTDVASGQHVQEWFDQAAGSATDGKGARVFGLSAFDSDLNSPNGGWTLKGDQYSTFVKLLGDAHVAHVAKP